MIEEAGRIFSALRDPSRLKLLRLLMASGEPMNQGVQYADDTLWQVQGTERFVQSRVEQGLLLKSEGDRTRACRAQSETIVVEAAQVGLTLTATQCAVLPEAGGLPSERLSPRCHATVSHRIRVHPGPAVRPDGPQIVSLVFRDDHLIA